ncbi:MAG: FtsQ-type POTRA domain-containing protein [Ruminococcaceae bacterium]|nr:FtsQ-type POTRA domain-containing protein [Oscillospiraceae bacterium]
MDTKEKTGQRRRAGSSPPKRRSEHIAQRKKSAVESPSQEVVYVPAKPFARNRLLVRLATVAAIVAALLLGMSVFFKVENVRVSGCVQYTAHDIKLASGIQNGDGLFSVGIPGVAAKIHALPFVKDVRVGIKLPHTVMIEITEVRVPYAIKAQDDSWWLVDSDGVVVKQWEESEQDTCTKILGVHILNPKAGQQAVAQDTVQNTEDENGNTISVNISNGKKLQLALKLADLLEKNGILGEAASIDVNDMSGLQIWYGQQYQIKLGDESSIETKISFVKGAIDKLSEESHNSGVLDVTFRNGEQIIYTRFK